MIIFGVFVACVVGWNAVCGCFVACLCFVLWVLFFMFVVGGCADWLQVTIWVLWVGLYSLRWVCFGCFWVFGGVTGDDCFGLLFIWLIFGIGCLFRATLL